MCLSGALSLKMNGVYNAGLFIMTYWRTYPMFLKVIVCSVYAGLVAAGFSGSTDDDLTEILPAYRAFEGAGVARKSILRFSICP